VAESKSVDLANRIVAILEPEDYHDAMDALRIVRILLPSPASRKRRAREEEDENPSRGDLPPADVELVRFSKAMGTPAVEAKKPEEDLLA
jgi:hypothetical protein